MTIRDKVNRQRETRKAAEQAKADAIARAEAEVKALEEAKVAAKAKAKAEEEVRLNAIQTAKEQALIDEKLRLEADKATKLKEKIDAREKLAKEAELVKQARVKAKLESKALAKAEARARSEKKAKIKADAKALKIRLKQERLEIKEKKRAEAKALKQQEKQARLEAKAKAKQEAENVYQQKLEKKRLAKEKARIATNEKAVTLEKIKEKAKADALKAEKARIKAKQFAKDEADELKKTKKLKEQQAKLEKDEQKRVEAQLKEQAKQQIKADALERERLKVKEISLELEKVEAQALLQEKKREEEAAIFHAQRKAEAKRDIELKEKAALEAKVKADEKLAERKALAKARVVSREKSRKKLYIRLNTIRTVLHKSYLAVKGKSLVVPKITLRAVIWLRSSFFKTITRITNYNFKHIARLVYVSFTLGITIFMAQLFIDRYPDTNNQDILYEVPIDPELAIIEGDEVANLTDMEESASVTATTTVVVVPSIKVEPVPELTNTSAIIPRSEPVPMLANWQINAVESDIPAGYPRLVIVIDDVGMSTAVSRRLAALKAPLTIAFLPYADRLEHQSSLVSNNGHEMLVHMPMAPKSKRVNPGNNALLDNLDRDEFHRRLNWNLSRFDGFIGINNHMGSSLTERNKEMRWVMAELKNRGLIFLDSVTTNHSVVKDEAQQAGVPTISRNVFLDNERDPEAIISQLKLAMDMSKRRGLSIAIGHPYPETITVLKEWLPKLEAEGIILTPLSAAISEKYFSQTLLASKATSQMGSTK